VQQATDRVNREPDEAAYQRAVDPYKLQISSHRQLEPLRCRLRIPTRDRLGDQIANLDPVFLHHAGREIDEQIVDFGEDGLVRL